MVDVFLFFPAQNPVSIDTSGSLSNVAYKTEFQLQRANGTQTLSGILCKKSKVFTDNTGHTLESLLILLVCLLIDKIQGTPSEPYWHSILNN